MFAKKGSDPNFINWNAYYIGMNASGSQENGYMHLIFMSIMKFQIKFSTSTNKKWKYERRAYTTYGVANVFLCMQRAFGNDGAFFDHYAHSVSSIVNIICLKISSLFAFYFNSILLLAKWFMAVCWRGTA